MLIFEVMIMVAQLGIRLEDKEKAELEKNAHALGLTAASAVKMMIAQFNYDKGFRFPINRRDSLDKVEKLPKEVEKALLVAKAEELGLIKDTSETVENIDDLRKRWGDEISN
jgi:DNA-damage-inducible protein J